MGLGEDTAGKHNKALDRTLVSVFWEGKQTLAVS